MAKIESLSELDEYYAEKIRKAERKEKSRKFALFFAIVFSIALGIIVYKVVDNMIPKDDSSEKNSIGEQLSLDNENVQILYEYVTSDIGGNRIMKFLIEEEVDSSSFSNQEKIEIALQFAVPEDFVFTGKYNDEKQKIYSFSTNTLHKYLKQYFGPNVTIEPEETITSPFLFTINQMNEGKMTYSDSFDGYEVVFASKYDFEEHKNLVEPAYGQLISALRQPDGKVVLQERVVYTELKTGEDGFSVDIYKDPQKQEKLDSKENLDEEALKQFQINISEYPSTAIVEYTFGINGKALYFSNSRIII